MLEDPADGVGCWSCEDMTVLSTLSNATFPTFSKLWNGGYGPRPRRPDHSLVVVNVCWTAARDIGQFWERCVGSRTGGLAAAAATTAAALWGLLLVPDPGICSAPLMCA